MSSVIHSVSLKIKFAYLKNMIEGNLNFLYFCIVNIFLTSWRSVFLNSAFCIFVIAPLIFKGIPLQNQGNVNSNACARTSHTFNSNGKFCTTFSFFTLFFLFFHFTMLLFFFSTYYYLGILTITILLDAFAIFAMGKSKKQKKIEKESGKRRENIFKERRKVLAKIAKDHDGYSSKGAKNVYISLFFNIICEHMF